MGMNQFKLSWYDHRCMFHISPIYIKILKHIVEKNISITSVRSYIEDDISKGSGSVIINPESELIIQFDKQEDLMEFMMVWG